MLTYNHRHTDRQTLVITLFTYYWCRETLVIHSATTSAAVFGRNPFSSSPKSRTNRRFSKAFLRSPD